MSVDDLTIALPGVVSQGLPMLQVMWWPMATREDVHLLIDLLLWLSTVRACRVRCGSASPAVTCARADRIANTCSGAARRIL